VIGNKPMQTQGKTGRQVFTSAESAVWTNRILKEKAAAAAARDCSNGPGSDGAGQHSHATMNDADAPRKFKAGAGAGPRERKPYPLTANQDLGWLLASRSDAAERFRRDRKLRLGFGWPDGPPANFSEVSAVPPTIEDWGASSSLLSAATPTELLSSCAPLAAHRNMSEASAGHASDLRASPPQPTRSSSLPVLGAAAVAGDAQRLRRRERKLQEAMMESRAYLNTGQQGRRWARHMISTDVTAFDNEFTKQNLGVPLYKMGR